MTATQLLMVVAGWIIVVFLGALGLIILWKIWKGDIDLQHLISEANGGASLSRL